MLWLLAEWKLVLCGLLAVALGYFVIANNDLNAENEKQAIALGQYAAAQKQNLETIARLQDNQKFLNDQMARDKLRSMQSYQTLQQRLKDITNAPKKRDAIAAPILNDIIDSMSKLPATPNRNESGRAEHP